MSQEPATPQSDSPKPKRKLGLWDTTSLIVGIVVGAGIFETPAIVFHYSQNLWQVMGFWLLGGFLSLVGAMCFAELATTYPRSGGEYVYLSKTYGSWLGFFFAWAQFAILRPAGTIGMLAVLFAVFAGDMFNIDTEDAKHIGFFFVMAVGSIVVLTGINILGVRLGTPTQNVLTALKVVGIGGIIIVGLVLVPSRAEESVPTQYLHGYISEVNDTGIELTTDGTRQSVSVPESAKIRVNEHDTSAETKRPFRMKDLRVSMYARVQQEPSGAVISIEAYTSVLPGMVTALVLVMWTFSGWHEAAYVVSEVNEGKRTIPLSLMVGTGTIVLIYLAVNLAYGIGLGFDEAGNAQGIARALFEKWQGVWGARIIAGVMMISCLGGLNGSIFTTSRLYSEMGTDHPLFAKLNVWNVSLGTPLISLIVQGTVSVGMVIVVGLFFHGRRGFGAMADCTAAVFWLFFFLTGLSVIILRVREPNLPRSFKVPLYPIIPIVFCLLCLGMVYSSTTYRTDRTLIGLGILAVGIPLYFLSERLRKPSTKPN